MTVQELGVVLKGIAPVVKEYITTEMDALGSRVKALETRPLPDGAPGPMGQKGDLGERGADGGIGPIGAPGERGESGAAGPQGEHGEPGLVGPMGPMGQSGISGRDGQPGLNGRDGEVRMQEHAVAGLEADVITASIDSLLRKELAALDAAAPPRLTRRVVRDARGNILRVVEEPAQG